VPGLVAGHAKYIIPLLLLGFALVGMNLS